MASVTAYADKDRSARAVKRYGTIAMLFHWAIAGAIIYMIWLGYHMNHDMEDVDPRRFDLMQLHKSIGLTILVLSVLRLAWRAFHPAPPLPAKMKPWELLAAKGTHYLFYAFMIGMPLVGWVLVSSSPLGLHTIVFKTFEWPHIEFLAHMKRAQKAIVYEPVRQVHMYLAYAALTLLVLHVGAALKHHFWDRDTVLTRMLPQKLANLLRRARTE